MNERVQPLAVSLGDPAGIGPEIVAKAWAERARLGLPVFFAVGDSRVIERVSNSPVAIISDPGEADAAFARALPVVHIDSGPGFIPGSPTVESARSALDALNLAAGLARSGAAGALVTAPVSKARLYEIGFGHSGQTEYISELCGVSDDNAAMMLVGPTLRTVPVTTHLPLRDVAGALSIDLIVSKARTAARGLRRDFGILEPRIAFAGFNPHAGEDGALGREEIELIGPAIDIVRAEGIDAQGPFAADAMFHDSARERYDSAICLYHDQALIPLKTLHFEEGVNLTLGLPIVRASPDHGTAFSIAGQDRAFPTAMIAAIALAAHCARHRARAA